MAIALDSQSSILQQSGVARAEALNKSACAALHNLAEWGIIGHLVVNEGLVWTLLKCSVAVLPGLPVLPFDAPASAERLLSNRLGPNAITCMTRLQPPPSQSYFKQQLADTCQAPYMEPYTQLQTLNHMTPRGATSQVSRAVMPGVTPGCAAGRHLLQALAAVDLGCQPGGAVCALHGRRAC